MSELAIETQGLRKNYGKLAAVDGLDLKVPRGTVYGFLGRNGAGKTTTIKSLLGLLRPTGGAARVLGMDVRAQLIPILERTGFVSENKMLFDTLTARQLIRFNKGYFPTWSDAMAEGYIREFEIPADTRFSKLSLGNKTKVCLMLALSQGADLLIIDEPTSGLDPVAVDVLMRTLIEDHVSQGKTVFVSSHHLSEIERIAEWVGIIDRGKLLVEARLDDIRHEFRMLTAAGQQPLVTDHPEIVFSQRQENFHRYIVSRNAEAFRAELGRRGLTVMESSPLSLSETFLALVRKEEPAPPRPASATVAVH